VLRLGLAKYGNHPNLEANPELGNQNSQIKKRKPRDRNRIREKKEPDYHQPYPKG